MKKIFCFLLCSMLLAGSLIAPAGATESTEYIFEVTPYLYLPMWDNANIDLYSKICYFNDTSVNFAIRGAAPVHGFYLTSDRLRTTSDQYMFTCSWQIDPGSREITDFPLPTTLTFNGTTYNFEHINKNRYDCAAGNIYVMLYLTNVNGVSTYHLFINFGRDYGDIFIPIDFKYMDDDVGDSFIGYTPSVIAVSDASNQDIIDSVNTNVGEIADILEQMMETNSAGSSDLVTALNQVGANITSTQTSTSNALQGSVNRVQATTEQVKQAVEVMEQNMSGNVADGLAEYDKQEEEKLTEELDGNVQDIVDKLPLLDQKDNFENATSAVINAFSDSSMDCNFTIPDGTVTVAGTSYTFWNSQEVDLNSIINNQYIQMLLIGFRFLIAYGLVFYMLEWINKIISLVLMEDTGLSAQEWRSEYRENVRARGYRK